jgi:hypothetical protein
MDRHSIKSSRQSIEDHNQPCSISQSRRERDRQRDNVKPTPSDPWLGQSHLRFSEVGATFLVSQIGLQDKLAMFYIVGHNVIGCVYAVANTSSLARSGL